MFLLRHLSITSAARSSTVLSRRLASSTAKRRKIVDETTLGGAQHKVSLSGPSLGRLISELSATRSDMEALRQPGVTMAEEHRTLIRNVVKVIVGVPVVVGAGIVGYNLLMRETGR